MTVLAALLAALALAAPPPLEASGPGARAAATGQRERCAGVVMQLDATRPTAARASSGLRLRLQPSTREGAPGWWIRVLLPADDERDLAAAAAPFADPVESPWLASVRDPAAELAPKTFRYALDAVGHDVLITAAAAIEQATDYADETIVEVRRAVRRVPLGTGTVRPSDASPARVEVELCSGP